MDLGGLTQVSYRGFEETKRFFDGLGDDADIADDGHEIDIAVPAGDDVGVDMPGYAGTGDFADIDADVETLGVHGAVECSLAEDDEFHDFGSFLYCAFGEGWGVAVGGDQQMPVDVGVFIEHEHAMGGAGEDEVGIVIFRCFGRHTEEAFLGTVGDGFDVVETPGSI